MAARKTLVGLSLLALVACGEGEIRQSTFSIEGFCSFTPQVAIIVEVFGAGDAKVDRVTAKRKREELCFLEHVARADEDDAGEPGAALYSCLAQGEGSYEVRVTSGTRTATQTIDVAGDECHVKKLQELRIDL